MNYELNPEHDSGTNDAKIIFFVLLRMILSKKKPNGFVMSF